MDGLKLVMKASRDANSAVDRCVCGHKKRMHGKAGCRAGFCRCKNYREAVPNVEETKEIS